MIALYDNLPHHKLAAPLVVTVRTYNYSRDANGNKIAAYTATVQLKSGASHTVAASGARRLQVGYQTGQHARALLALEQAGYALELLDVIDGVARYAIA
jgi:hypothetical protein